MVSYQNSALISKSISLSYISTARILVKLLQVATTALAAAGLYRGIENYSHITMNINTNLINDIMFTNSFEKYYIERAVGS